MRSTITEINLSNNLSNIDKLRVSSRSNPNSVAGAITGAVREHKNVIVTVIGAGAVNQAIKAIAIANGYLAPNGIRLSIVPGFKIVEVNGENRTAINLELRRF